MSSPQFSTMQFLGIDEKTHQLLYNLGGLPSRSESRVLALDIRPHDEATPQRFLLAEQSCVNGIPGFPTMAGPRGLYVGENRTTVATSYLRTAEGGPVPPSRSPAQSVLNTHRPVAAFIMANGTVLQLNPHNQLRTLSAA